MLRTLCRRFALLVAAVVLAAALPARAADPYEINVILSLSGPAAFVGQDQQQALKALEGWVNKTGGIAGRPLAFAFADDQTQPAVAVQLATALIAKHVPIILGTTIGAQCHAVSALIGADGPVFYCLTPFVDPAPGSFVFATFPTGVAQEHVMFRYLRSRKLTRMAYLVTTDASGQDSEHAIVATAADPENAGVTIVAKEHFAPTDLAVDAQMAAVKAAKPDVVFVWATGTAAGTALRALQSAGLDVPVVSSSANLTAAFFRQYAALLPKELYFAGMPIYAGDALSDRGTKAALANMYAALDAIGAKPDSVKTTAWDPGLLLVDALRKLGPGASATAIRAQLAATSDWAGTNGRYNFKAVPQRGIGENNVLVVKWDGKDSVVGVSAFGGAPLRGR